MADQKGETKYVEGLAGLQAAEGKALATFPQKDPKTGEVFATYTQMTDEVIQGACVAAGKAFKEWRRVPVAERIKLLAPLAGVLREKAEQIAALMCKEMGKLVSQGKAEVEKCAGLMDWYVLHAPGFLADKEYPAAPGFTRSFVTYQPLGVVLAIEPWNFPLMQVLRMSFPTMLAGNAMLLKHAPNCFGTAALCEEMIGALPGVPQGLFHSLVCDVRQVNMVLEHDVVRGVALTGSERAGRAVAAKAGSLLKKCVVELGGSDGYAVLADADVEKAAEAIVKGRLLNTGQVCISPKRAIVERSLVKAFERRVVQKLSAKEYGKDFGPMVHTQGRDEVAKQVEATVAMGARLLHGGPAVPAPEGDTGGAFFAPAVLAGVKPGMPAFDQEIFGPVIAIIEAESDQDAIDLANQSPYGLGSGVFTENIARGQSIAVSEMDAGMCYVNDFVQSHPSLPFGGIKNSGLGREMSDFGIHEFVNVKTICIK